MRRRTMGLAVGSLWLLTVSAMFGIWALIAIGTPAARAVLVAALAVMSVIVVFGVVVARAVARMPPEPARQDEQSPGRRFAWIVGTEVLAFAVVNTWAGLSGRFILIPSLDLMVVGLHFFPLATLFRVPRYHVMAFFFCAIPAATLLLLPEPSLVGHAQSWYVLPSLGCGAVAALTATASLREAWGSVSRNVTIPSR